MSSQPSWRPNLPESQLFNEKTWLQGGTISSVAYGVNIALFILIIPLLITQLKISIEQNGQASRLTICLLTYVCAMFILGTLSIASQAEMTQLSFIENRDFPGGPAAAYRELVFSFPISILGGSCTGLMNWFSSGLLLWRCSVIYRSSRAPVWLVMTIPGSMLLASFVTGTIFLWRTSQVSSSPWAKNVFKLDWIYSIITFSLDMTLTLMIVIRLYIHRRYITKLLGRRHTTHYTSIISMLIESAAVEAIMTLWFLIPLTMGNPLANIPLVSAAQIQAAASYMIIFRVAKGTAWTSQTMNSEFIIHNMPEHAGSISNIRFHITSVEHLNSPVTSPPRNQFSPDGPLDVLDTQSRSRGTMKVHLETP